MQDARNRGRGARRRQPQDITVPVVEEDVSIAKQARDVERVRVAKRATSRTVEVDATSTYEEIHVERVPIGREVAHPPKVRVEGDTTVIPVMEEVVVVERRLVLKEEIRITKRRTTRPKRLRVPVRVERVGIERELSKGELERRGGAS